MGLARYRMGQREEEQSEVVQIFEGSQISFTVFCRWNANTPEMCGKKFYASIWALEGLMMDECCLCSPTIWRSGGRTGGVWRHIGHIQRMHTRTLHGALIQRTKVSNNLHDAPQSKLGDEADLSNRAQISTLHLKKG